MFYNSSTEPTFTCSKSTMETPDEVVKPVNSKDKLTVKTPD